MRYRNQEIIKNKTFINLKKNKEKHICFPSSSIKKNGYMAQLNKNFLFNYYSSSFIGKKNAKNKINNNSYINNLLISKSKKNLNLTRGCIIKSINNISKNNKKIYLNNNDIKKINNNSNIQSNIIKLTKLKNCMKNNSVYVKNSKMDNKRELKKYQSLIHKKDNNINIRININNNNIIYNKIVNNKSIETSLTNNNDKIPLGLNIQKIEKSPSFNINKKQNISKKMNKIKFIHIKFPKAKFLNIFNNTNQ